MAIDFDRLKAALADRYAIEREVGQGGMATVYLAHDIRHRREVAVKVVEPDLAAALGHERFVREIETAASLNHPHILGLHDSGEADGYLYYVMPYMAGESLRDRLGREGQLPVPDALQIAREVSDALGYAHRQGIVHRDIKPGNILLSEGHAVIADFGIAKAIAEAGGDKLAGTSAAQAMVHAGEAHVTQTGIAIGSPMYMSPEQASGDRALDGRSDIYSLGCVLYEMLAGEPPYTATSAEAVIAKHMTGFPTPLSDLRDTVPGSLDAAVAVSLAKEPDNRFADAGKLEDALSVDSLLQITPAVDSANTKQRLIPWSYLFPIGVLALVLVFGNSVVTRSIRTQVGDQLETILDSSIAGVEVWLENQETIGTELAKDSVVRNSITTLAGVGAFPGAAVHGELAADPAQAELREYLDPIAESLDYMGFVAVDLLGRVVAATEDILLGYRLESDHPVWQYLRPTLDGQTVVSPPLPSLVALPDEQGRPSVGRPIMVVMAPILDSGDRVIGALGFRIAPENDFTRLLQIGRMGESGQTYAFNRDGLMVSESRFDDQLRKIGLLPVHPDARGILNVQVRDPGGNMLEGYRSDVPYSELPLTTMAASATAGRDGIDLDGYRDYRGVDVVGAWRWLPEYGIGITTEIDELEAFATRERLRGIITSGAVLLGILYALFFLIRGLIRRRRLKAERVHVLDQPL